MGLLHRHIFASVLIGSLVAVSLFGFIFIAGTALRDLLGFVVAGQIPWETAAKLIVLLMPYAAVYTLPIGVLTTVLLVLGRMSSQQEITAMRAAGLSLHYIARPIWLIGGAAVLLSLALNFYVMPAARTAYKMLENEALSTGSLSLITPKTFVRDPKGSYVLYVGGREGRELHDFWLWRLDKQKRVWAVVRARSGTVIFRDEDRRLVLTLREVSVETRDRKRPEDFSKPQLVPDSESMTVELELEEVFKKKDVLQKVSWLTLDELLALRTALGEKGEEANPAERLNLAKVNVALNERAAASFGVLALVFVAVPLGIKVSRKETSANLGIAVVLVLGYYFLAGLVGTLERSPSLRPELWVWAPPLVYAVAGLWLFRRVDRA